MRFPFHSLRFGAANSLNEYVKDEKIKNKHHKTFLP